ncbi:hypothetical protein E3N88_04399 [Mikania micrantha]|uniref:Reverse transcriptase Ty1/copia-type domain-containing protein n=1 Tax=Mikania micrantha TaxID=192012 RepID=A0A5N6PWF2_9ASTR|nr:hypothetical protein E3N88_04399 [Mikania micrantha]
MINNNSSIFDHTPPKGLKSVQQIYQKTTALTDEQVQEKYDMWDELLLVSEEPTTYEDAADIPSWKAAMQAEIEAIHKDKTWTLVQLPSNHKAIGLKWVYKLKKDANGNITRHKACLVAKGYVQKKGIDFEEAFAPAARIETIRLILAMAAKDKWVVHHLDVKSAFINGDLQEEVYVTQPKGFEVKGKESMVFKLHKALYGLRQAPRAWNLKLEKSLKDKGFHKCAQEQAVYKLHKTGSILIVGVYVDDLIVTGSSERVIYEFKEKMKVVFEMSDLGKLSYYLGIEVCQDEGSITLNQERYAIKILETIGMLNCNEAKWPMESKLQLFKDEEGKDVNLTEYRKIVGSLRYLVHTRPDLSYSVGVVSKYMQTPKESHYAAVKQILRYLKGTTGYGLRYCSGGDAKLIGYSDSSYGTDLDDRRGTTGIAFYFSGKLITWCS